MRRRRRPGAVAGALGGLALGLAVTVRLVGEPLIVAGVVFLLLAAASRRRTAACC